MLCNINLCKYFRDIVGVRVGILCAWRIHCVSNGVGKTGNFSSLLLRCIPLVVLSRNNVRVIGDLIQSWWDMRGSCSDPSCLASICFVSPLYILPSLSLSLRALISCSPIQVMYAFFNEKASVPNISCGSCVTALDIHFGRPYIVL